MQVPNALYRQEVQRLRVPVDARFDYTAVTKWFAAVCVLLMATTGILQSPSGNLNFFAKSSVMKLELEPVSNTVPQDLDNP